MGSASCDACGAGTWFSVSSTARVQISFAHQPAQHADGDLARSVEQIKVQLEQVQQVQNELLQWRHEAARAAELDEKHGPVEPPPAFRYFAFKDAVDVPAQEYHQGAYTFVLHPAVPLCYKLRVVAISAAIVCLQILAIVALFSSAEMLSKQ